MVGLRVLALNTWGMPAKVGSEDKELRMKVAPCPSSHPPPQAIGEYIQKAEYDVYLLAELWMRPDHATIKALIPKVSSNNSFSSLLFFVADLVLHHVHLHFTIPQGYYMSNYGDFNLATCDGRISPFFCAGLAIVSR